jgi:transposase
MTAEIEMIVNDLYNQGKNDAEIARVIKMCTETVRGWRLKNGYPKNFNYSDRKKVLKTDIEPLVNKGLNDIEIAKILGVSTSTIYHWRKFEHIERESFSEAKSSKLSQYQLEVMVGTLLGDSSLRKEFKNPKFSCEHGYAQKDYAFHKYEVFKSLGASYRESTRSTIDSRTGIYYKSAIVSCPANPEFLPLYNHLYKDKKVITLEFLKNFTAVSLAYLFMDDGCKSNGTVAICTNCFTISELELFVNFLKTKFNLHFNIHKNNTIYLQTRDFKLFVSIVFPHLLESFYYKINITKL